jgi:hypothetical protein
MTDPNRINAAIRECLDQCYASQTPLPCLAEYVALLRGDPGWSDAEVAHVENTVRQILKGIVSEPRDDSLS